jgi:signal transduction histidine kinase
MRADDTVQSRKQNEELMSLQAEYASAQREKEIELLEAESALQKNELSRKNLLNYLLGAGIISLLLIVLILVNRSRLKSQLRETQLRNKIASDLHDDIGATLSSIKLYSEMAAEQIKEKNPKTVPVLQKISGSSKEMIDAMSDIVWMVKPGNDRFSNLEDRMTNFAVEICSAGNIGLQINKDERVDSLVLPMEMRRDIYLVFKEAMNNAVKYSDAKLIEVDIYNEKNVLHIKVRDKGKGFDTATVKKGNGLENMKRRLVSHSGDLEIISKPGEGTTVHAALPIP